MKQKNIFLLLSLFLFFSVFSSSAANSLLDSLKKQLLLAAEDTSKINILIKLSMENSNNGDFENALRYGKESIALCEKEPGISEARRKVLLAEGSNVIGIAFDYKSDYTEALKYYGRALQLFSEISDKKGMARCNNNLGLVYESLGNNDMAIDYILKGLVLREEIAKELPDDKENKMGVGQSVFNLGMIQEERKDYENALNSYQRASALFDDLDFKRGKTACLINIGNLYKYNHDNKGALKNYLDAYEIAKTMDDKFTMSVIYNNLSGVYFNLKDFDNAEKFAGLGYRAKEALGDKVGMAMALVLLSDAHREQGKIVQSVEEAERSLKIASEIASVENVVSAYLALSETYEKLDIKKAYGYHKLYSQFKDSLLNEESEKNMNELQTKYETEKKNTEIILLNKDKEIQSEELKKQRIFIYSAILVIALVLSLVLIIFRSNKQKQLANLHLEKKNQEILLSKKEIEKKNSELEGANAAITFQKMQIEEKNEEILSSIRYAKRIQQAVLKEEERVTMYLPDHFVLFKPKDIVSGDFYWAKEIGDWWYVAVADCTGHGVPGAFLTMLGMSFLNEITLSAGRMRPSEILGELRTRIIKELGQTGKAGESKDGMDISLCCINLKTLEMEWAGANNPLYLISDNEFLLKKIPQEVPFSPKERSFSLFEIKADKQPIGYFPDPKPFRNLEFQLQNGYSVFLFSDGYADQFGGPKGKKFKYSRLENLLLSIHGNPMAVQKDFLITELEKWKGSLEQVDDICLIGIKV